MNNKQPFEDAFERRMDNLPLPSEHDAWQKMNRMLDEKDNRKKPVLLFRFLMLAIIFIALSVALWVYYTPENTYHSKIILPGKNNTAGNTENAPGKNIATKPASHEIQNDINTLNKHKKQNIPAGKNESIAKTNMARTAEKGFEEQQQKQNKNIVQPNGFKQTESRQKLIAKLKPKRKNLLDADHPQSGVLPHILPEKNEGKNILPEKEKDNAIAGVENVLIKKDNAAENRKVIKDNTQQVDSTQFLPPTALLKDNLDSGKKPMNNTRNADATFITDSLEAAKSTPAKNNTVTNKKRIYVNAGIGLQQQIPVSGQQIYSYGYKGNNAMSDYIPSVFIRLERDKKWYVQGEFKYGAPQLIHMVPYSQQTSGSSTNFTITTTRLVLQKTFYHQIPVSFNYYVRPNWSVGVGGMYSILQGAIAESEVSVKNLQTQQQTFARQQLPINSFTDSFLYKTNAHLLIQSDYHWRRFSLALRYSKNVQPFIKYTLPDGAIEEKRNWSIDVILRFRLWKSGVF